MMIFTGNIITYPDNSRVLLEKLFQKKSLIQNEFSQEGGWLQDTERKSTAFLCFRKRKLEKKEEKYCTQKRANTYFYNGSSNKDERKGKKKQTKIRTIPCSSVRRFNGVKIHVLPKLTFIFNFMSIKIHYEVFMKVDRV